MKIRCEKVRHRRNQRVFDTYKDLDFDSVVYKKVINVLNYLLKCFPADPGNYQYFNKHVWVLTVYTAISELKDGYALNGKENDVRVITENFHDKVYSEVWRDSDSSLQRFYEKHAAAGQKNSSHSERTPLRSI